MRHPGKRWFEVDPEQGRYFKGCRGWTSRVEGVGFVSVNAGVEGSGSGERLGSFREIRVIERRAMNQRSTDNKNGAKSGRLGQTAKFAGIEAELGNHRKSPQSLRIPMFTKSLAPRSVLGFVSSNVATVGLGSFRQTRRRWGWVRFVKRGGLTRLRSRLGFVSENRSGARLGSFRQIAKDQMEPAHGASKVVAMFDPRRVGTAHLRIPDFITTSDWWAVPTLRGTDSLHRFCPMSQWSLRGEFPRETEDFFKGTQDPKP